ncbi:MAG TPA: aminodeoxychorismate synthase component I [Bacteroidales bacterium]
MKMVKKTAIDILNQLGAEHKPFLFIIDFEQKKPLIFPLEGINSEEILFDVNGKKNFTVFPEITKSLEFSSIPVSEIRYREAFELVQNHLHYGNSFLLNLTMPSQVETNFSLKEIFYHSKAKYKLWLKDSFVVFSPEIFVKTDGRKISSFPMKGTIDATLPDAENLLLKNEKELAEHYTIVDLIRNDLSMVAKNVKVERFRYIDRIKTHRHVLLQMSSEISGELPENYMENLGNILFKMLPAGSISGAPKKKTIEIIKEAEQYERGYYTGIFGIFDGTNIDSGVMIRFIEQSPKGLVYKSGGGITAKSNCEEEYQELIDKIYVPLA